jgi:predicted esterase
MYGPGEAWFDDIKVRFVADSTPIQLATSDSGEEEDISDIKDVPSVEFQAKKDPKKNYFLIGSKGKGPEKGYKLLLIMPGGDGSKDFNSFVRRMWKNGELQKMGFVVAELVAPVWETSENRIVWPIRSSQVPAAQFNTEVFVNDVIADVQSKLKIDPEHIYAMGWSSGGVSTYAALLDSPSLKGAFVAMSIFNEQMYPTLSLAKGRSVYLYQSPDDKVTKYFFAEKARDAFKGVGARVELASYPGGHGFSSGQPFEDIKLGLEWLTKR